MLEAEDELDRGSRRTRCRTNCFGAPAVGDSLIRLSDTHRSGACSRSKPIGQTNIGAIRPCCADGCSFPTPRITPHDPQHLLGSESGSQTCNAVAGARDTEWGRDVGKKLAEAESRAKQDAAAHEKRVAQLDEQLRDARRCNVIFSLCMRRQLQP